VFDSRTLNLQLTFQPLSLLRWQLYAAQSMRNKWTSGVFGDTFADEEDTDQDSLKEALLETSPYLLGLTFVISILHSIFEILAFKNGIAFIDQNSKS
jgi:Cleft lip and palate transmembrane protein 1 (CLPTM1)